MRNDSNDIPSRVGIARKSLFTVYWSIRGKRDILFYSVSACSRTYAFLLFSICPFTAYMRPSSRQTDALFGMRIESSSMTNRYERNMSRQVFRVETIINTNLDGRPTVPTSLSGSRDAVRMDLSRRRSDTWGHCTPAVTTRSVTT